MVRARISINHRAKKPRKQRRKERQKLPIVTYVKVFLILTLIWASLAGLLWLTGIFDFTAQRGGRRLTACGFLYAFTPDELKSNSLCVTYNLLPFILMPGFVLVMLVRRVFTGERK